MIKTHKIKAVTTIKDFCNRLKWIFGEKMSSSSSSSSCIISSENKVSAESTQRLFLQTSMALNDDDY